MVHSGISAFVAHKLAECAKGDSKPSILAGFVFDGVNKPTLMYRNEACNQFR